jgi:hypothetical protein
LAEKQLLSDSRSAEIGDLKAQAANLMHRLAQHTTSAQSGQETTSIGSERVQQAQAELALIQAELNNKEVALEERQAKLAATEQALHAQVSALQEQLARNESLLEIQTQNFVLGEARLADVPLEHTWKLQERLDAAASENSQRGSNHYLRKWRTAGGWKRRWKFSGGLRILFDPTLKDARNEKS